MGLGYRPIKCILLIAEPCVEKKKRTYNFAIYGLCKKTKSTNMNYTYLDLAEIGQRRGIIKP